MTPELEAQLTRILCEVEDARLCNDGVKPQVLVDSSTGNIIVRWVFFPQAGQFTPREVDRLMRVLQEANRE